ncbi:hypothetical protein B0H10DRAFT_2240114 [Mycena sp. CBHHK59/15]|nr:hypothetical protein B0H10DRAFT_2240114 [Mycena sp. CBHHK59/15]
MGWSMRCATRAAQKIPANYKEVLTAAFLREAIMIRDYNIPAELRVNTDQTQAVYQQGTKATWTTKGEKQVATVGHEEKCALTLVPSIFASGEMLRMQAVFLGKTGVSLPQPGSRGYAEAISLGFKLEVSGNGKYWSTQGTMRTLVTDIIAPYFDTMKQELGASVTAVSGLDEETPSDDPSLLRAGRCSSHRDVVEEVTTLLNPDDEDEPTNATLLKLDTTLPVLRNRCVGWIVDAFHACNNRELILKAYELCAVGTFNCSHASLTSSAASTALRELPQTNRALHLGLTGEREMREEIVNEDLFAENEEDLTYNDESGIPIAVLVKHVVSGGLAALPEGFMVAEDGNLARNGAAEDSELNVNAEDLLLTVRRPKRSAKAPRQYGGHEMWEQ